MTTSRRQRDLTRTDALDRLLYAHIPLQAAIVAVGVAVKKAIHFSWNPPAPDKYRWLLAGSLAVVYFSVAAIDSVTERKQAELGNRARINFRWLSGLVLLVPGSRWTRNDRRRLPACRVGGLRRTGSV